MKTRVKIAVPPRLDLRGITRDTNACRTVVYIDSGLEKFDKFEWILCGQASIKKHPHEPGRFQLDVRTGHGMTDESEDSAYALCLPLIGVTFDVLPVLYHTTRLVAWVDPSDPDFFRVPPPGYDPRKLPGAYKCTDTDCKPKGHYIVPEFMPPHDAQLYQRVAGKRLEIHIGPVFPEK